MPAKKCGLRVKHSASVAKVTGQRGSWLTYQAMPLGWYVWVKIAGKWNALTDLRFVREQDALRAAESLTAAGLDTESKLKQAGLETVKQVACECLQW